MIQPENYTLTGLILRFIWRTLTRFAKTLGLLCLIAGFGVAGYLYQQQAPLVEAVRYRPSTLLTERLDKLAELFSRSHRLVTDFKGTETPGLSFEPKFLATYTKSEDFPALRQQLNQIGTSKEAMKSFVVNRLEAILTDIQRQLLAHAAQLTPPPSASNPQPQPTPPPEPFVEQIEGLYAKELSNSELDSRRSSLENARQYLAVLESSAENPENKKKLEDSMAEIERLGKLLPESAPPPPSSPTTPTVPFKFEPKEPLNAEKVASRIAQIRNSVRQAVLSSWALDEAYDRALETAEREQSACLSADRQVKELSAKLHLGMAVAIAAGVLIGTFFFLIGDWTEKASTELLCDPYCALIKNFSAAPKDVYDTVEQYIAVHEIPELEVTRAFWHEGGALSAKREYLKLARERLGFEICAAPFGTDFFISFRIAVVPLVIDPLGILCLLAVTGAILLGLIGAFGLLWAGVILAFAISLLLFATRTAVARGLANVDRMFMKTPLIAPLYELFLRPSTYYRIDSMTMYVQAIQDAVAEAFQAMFGEQQIDFLPNRVPQPVLNGIYRGRF